MVAESTLSAHEIISIITDPVRWDILKCLRTNAGKSSKEIALELDRKAALIQYHLKGLVRTGLVQEYSHPDYPTRFLYSRRKMRGNVIINSTGLSANVDFQ